MVKKILKRTILIGLAAIILLFGLGTVYQTIGSKADRKGYKATGQLIEVKGKNMHLYAGGAGDTTVVLASGWATPNPYTDFYPLYEKLGTHAKFVVYDRFGYGFSDRTEEKRDIDTMVEEARAALTAGGQKPPYVLVGHSLGSLEVIRYAQKYPDEVKGVLLIDGGTPEFYAKDKALTFISKAQRFLVNTGIARMLYSFEGGAGLINSERNKVKLLPDEMKELDRKATLLHGNNATITDEMRHSTDNAAKVAAGTKPLKVPLTALTQDSDRGVWLDSQKTWPEWSTEGKQFVVEDTRHYIHQYRPDIVAEEILKLVKR